jgi:hypothetical protein
MMSRTMAMMNNHLAAVPKPMTAAIRAAMRRMSHVGMNASKIGAKRESMIELKR